MLQGASVAAVIPCYRQRNFLARAIESALDQPPAEIIVVDDGNEEDLSDFATSYPAITLLRQDNRGLAGARNAGFERPGRTRSYSWMPTIFCAPTRSRPAWTVSK